MRSRAYTDVAARILQRVEAGDYASGARLPSERQLAETFNVSRSTVREALAALELMGAIETHLGAGSYVSERLNGVIAAEVQDASPADIVAARLVLEPQLARLAARNHDRGSLGAIARPVRLLERQAEAGEDAHPTDVDRRFHAAIARAGGNPVLVLAAAPLWTLMEEALWNRLKERAWIATRTAAVASQHRSIYEAIRARDEDLAAFEMERHLRTVRNELYADEAR